MAAAILACMWFPFLPAQAEPAQAESPTVETFPDLESAFLDARVEVLPGALADSKVNSLVVRFLVPEIARKNGKIDYERVAPIMDDLCNGIGLEIARGNEARIDEIVIRLMDRVVEWGQSEPDATQFISTYAVTDAGCEWQWL